MLTDANAKFLTTRRSDFFHFCDILSDSANGWKYASFKGVEIALTP